MLHFLSTTRESFVLFYFVFLLKMQNSVVCGFFYTDLYKRNYMDKYNIFLCVFCFSGRGCTHLHTFCTLYKKAMLSLHCSHSVYFAAQKRESYAKSTRVSSRRSSASICRMASRIILPVIFVATGILFSMG